MVTRSTILRPNQAQSLTTPSLASKPEEGQQLTETSPLAGNGTHAITSISYFKNPSLGAFLSPPSNPRAQNPGQAGETAKLEYGRGEGIYGG